MDIQPLLAYNTWLSLPRETRAKLTEVFGIPRTGEVIVRSGTVSPQGNIQGEVTNDGHAPKDLYAITTIKMQDYVGAETNDFHLLFNLVLAKINGTEVVVEQTVTKRGGRPKGSKNKK